MKSCEMSLIASFTNRFPYKKSNCLHVNCIQTYVHMPLPSVTRGLECPWKGRQHWFCLLQYGSSDDLMKFRGGWSREGRGRPETHTHTHRQLYRRKSMKVTRTQAQVTHHALTVNLSKALILHVSIKVRCCGAVIRQESGDKVKEEL